MGARPTLFVPKLRANQRRRIVHALKKTRDARYRDRLRAILWSEEGKSKTEIARLLGKDPSTVFLWIKDYLRFGFQGLQIRKSTGRPSLVDAEAEEVLRRAVEKNPRDLGYGFTVWSLGRLAEHLYREAHVRVHPETIRRALRRMGFCFKRPRLSLKHRQDPAAVRRAKRARDAALKKGRDIRTSMLSSSRTNANSISIPA